MRRFLQPIFLVVLFVLGGCSSVPSDPPASQLSVFAAASLTEAFTAIAAGFEAQHPEVDVQLNFAGSQTLRLQVEQGARADVFASANRQHMAALLAAGLVEEPVIFAHNQLVVIMPAANPASIKTLADLTRPGLKLVLAGPAVPVGRYAREALENLSHHPSLSPNFSQQVLANVVSEEDTVKGVVAKVQLGEADAGIVYISDLAPAVADAVITLPISPAYNVIADYPIALVSESEQPDPAQRFVDFVTSSPGQTILAEHRFLPVQPPESKP